MEESYSHRNYWANREEMLRKQDRYRKKKGKEWMREYWREAQKRHRFREVKDVQG
jgi:hypothetical protein